MTARKWNISPLEIISDPPARSSALALAVKSEKKKGSFGGRDAYANTEEDITDRSSSGCFVYCQIGV